MRLTFGLVALLAALLAMVVVWDALSHYELSEQLAWYLGPRHEHELVVDLQPPHDDASGQSTPLAREAGSAPAPGIQGADSIEKHGLTYIDISEQNSMEALARATNGAVMHVDRNPDPGIGTALMKASEEDGRYALLFSAEGVAETGSADFEFLVDSTVSPLSMNVSGLKARPRVEIRDASGAVVTPTETLSTSKSDRLLFASGARGLWTLHLETSPGENVRVVVKGKSALRFHHVWAVRASADREYKGPLDAGKEEVFEVALREDALKGIIVQLVSLDGHRLQKGSAGNDSYPLDAARVKVTIPDEAFRLQVEGERSNGERVARMYEWSFEPGKLENLSFDEPEREESEETCKFLSRRGSYFVDGDKRNPGWGSISCVRREKTLLSNLSFDLPAMPDGAPRTTTLRSPAGVQATQADCEHWRQLFDRYPKQLVTGTRRASWSFRCTGTPENSRGEVEVTVDAVQGAVTRQ